MNSVAAPAAAITMEILPEIGRTKIIVRRADLGEKSALIRAQPRALLF